MRLGELLMLRAQLQKDLEEHAGRVSSNAVREVGDADPPSYDPVEALRGFWTVQQKLHRVQHLVQRTNATERYNEQLCMAEALLERELLRKQLPTVSAMLKAASVKTVTKDRYSTYEEKKVEPLVSVSELRASVNDLKQRCYDLDVNLQKRNWEITLTEPT